jgi:hypothetical protein
MPKVPVYASQAAPTTDTGMVSYTRAQKDSRPFIQAALAKGEVAGTAASLISNFIDGRIRSEGDLQADTALAGADAALEGEVSRLQRSRNPAAVFGADLTNDDSWFGAVEDVRTSASQGLSSYARKQFNTKFAAKAAQHRAKLRTAIDERVVNAQIALHDTNSANLIMSFSNINNTDAYPNGEEMLRSFTNAIADHTNNGLKLVYEGKLLMDQHQANLLKIVKDVAENSLTLFLNEQPNALVAYEMLTSGDPEEAEMLSLKHPNGAFAMHMLKLLEQSNPADRIALLDSLEKRAFQEYDNSKKREKDELDAIKRGNEKLINEIFEPDTSDEQIKANLKILRDQNFITPSMQNLIAKLETSMSANAVFRTQEEGDNEAVLQALDGLVPFGALTYDILAENADELTQETFRSLMNDVGTIRKDKWSEIEKGFRYEFGYAEEQGNDIEEYEQQAKQSYQQARRLWRRYKLENPRASAIDMQNEYNRIVEAEREKLDQVIKIELRNTLKLLEENGTYTDPQTQVQTRLTFPRNADGTFDLGQVLNTLSNHIETTGQSLLALDLDMVRYYLDMMEGR